MLFTFWGTNGKLSVRQTWQIVLLKGQILVFSDDHYNPKSVGLQKKVVKSINSLSLLVGKVETPGREI